MSTREQIFAIERPHPRLLWLYAIRSVLSGPLILLVGPLLFFRYETLRYRFDVDGVSMSWGILFRHEVHLAYRRIQDIHLQSGVLQRWLGLADIQIQTASGNAAAEMTIEGLLEFEDVRAFLYEQMRGASDGEKGDELAKLLVAIQEELRGTREALERLGSGADD